MASESRSRNDDALKQAIAILEEANLFSWHVSKEEVWVGWQNCPTSASPLKKALDLLRSVVPSETQTTLEDVLSWADGVRSDFGTENARKITLTEAKVADAITKAVQ